MLEGSFPNLQIRLALYESKRANCDYMHLGDFVKDYLTINLKKLAGFSHARKVSS